MDIFVTIEMWEPIFGGWQRTPHEPKNLTEATQTVQSLTNEALLVYGEHPTYRIIETKIASIWEGGNEIAPTEKLRHRGCTL